MASENKLQNFVTLQTQITLFVYSHIYLFAFEMRLDKKERTLAKRYTVQKKHWIHQVFEARFHTKK